MSENPIATIALLGAAEAVVYLFRYRTAVGDRALSSAFWTFATCVLRILVIATGAAAALGETPVGWLVVAYAGTAAGVTWVLQRRLSRTPMTGA